MRWTPRMFSKLDKEKTMEKLIELVDKLEPNLIEVWHFLHQHPELSMQEYNTANYLENKLKAYTNKVSIRRVGETGLWVELIGGKKGKNSNRVLVLRGDMDALPIQENTNLPYKSVIPNVMHACGHDVHSTILLGTVSILEKYVDQIEGRIWFFFQPGEEVMKGALTFLNDSRIDFSKVSAVAGIHVIGDVLAGKIRLKTGPVLASSDDINLTVKGKSGHAAAPQNSRDAIVASADLIIQLQNLISRETDPTDPTVLTLGTIHGGVKNNVIAGEVRIAGTLRTLNVKTRKALHEGIYRVAKGIEISTGVSIIVDIKDGSSPLLNDPKYVQIAEVVAKQLLGDDSVVHAQVPGLAGEDFAYFTEKVPGVFIFIGAQSENAVPARGHTPSFYTDSKALRTGVIELSGFALKYLNVEY